jgi:uncharacterized membrane-anchored protein
MKSWLAATLLFLTTPALAQEAAPIPPDMQQLVDGLRYQQGEITLQDGLAKLTVPEGFRFLGPEDTETVLFKLWHNPPGGTHPLGMLFPAHDDPQSSDGWAVVISYEADGHVKDDEANEIDYAALLKQMQASSKEENVEREKQGYPAVSLVGWAEPPHYDAAGHKLYWARELAFGGEANHTLNYDIRMLGRKGVLVLNSVGSMSQLAQIRDSGPQLLSMVDFNPGHRYVDFDSSTDKVASYGLAALVAGGIAGKLGLFKGLVALLLAAKKFVIVAVIGAGASLRKLFGRSKPGPTEIASNESNRPITPR